MALPIVGHWPARSGREGRSRIFLTETGKHTHRDGVPVKIPDTSGPIFQ